MEAFARNEIAKLRGAVIVSMLPTVMPVTGTRAKGGYLQRMDRYLNGQAHGRV